MSAKKKKAPPGKWADPNIPKTDWVLRKFTDLNFQPSALRTDVAGICEMCEIRHIRYEHLMAHDQWPVPIRAGKICAGRMSGDLDGAARREREARNRAQRVEKWPDRVGWKVSSKGTHYIVVENILVVVYQDSDESWPIRVKCRYSERETKGKKQFDNLQTALLTSYDAFEYARDVLKYGVYANQAKSRRYTRSNSRYRRY